jgi:F-type H+/Na+-transporting ATPase subunit alpha
MTNDHGARAESWLGNARHKLDAAALGPKAEEIGRVEEVGDGIALVSGLPDARLAELLRFEKGQFGFVQSLERDRIGCVLLDDVDGVEAGDSVRGTGDVVRAPVGPEMLGRVVDPLGRPLDGKGPISAAARPSVASSSSPKPRVRRGCNGSRPSRPSPWPNIFAIAVDTRSSSSTI